MRRFLKSFSLTLLISTQTVLAFVSESHLDCTNQTKRKLRGDATGVEIVRGEASQALAEAIDYLEEALRNESNLKWRYMLRTARRVRIIDVSGTCNDAGTAAYVVPLFGNLFPTIFVCSAFFGHPAVWQTQTMLHELAHLAFVLNECRADAVAREVLNTAGGDTYPSGYDQQCAIAVSFNNESYDQDRNYDY